VLGPCCTTLRLTSSGARIHPSGRATNPSEEAAAKAIATEESGATDAHDVHSIRRARMITKPLQTVCGQTRRGRTAEEKTPSTETQPDTTWQGGDWQWSFFETCLQKPSSGPRSLVLIQSNWLASWTGEPLLNFISARRHAHTSPSFRKESKKLGGRGANPPVSLRSGRTDAGALGAGAGATGPASRSSKRRGALLRTGGISLKRRT
jgi:hypothetical protein